MRRKKSEYYGGGWKFYCNECSHAHHIHSGIGKRHIGFGSVEVQRKAFIDFKIFKRIKI